MKEIKTRIGKLTAYLFDKVLGDAFRQAAGIYRAFMS